MIRKLRKSVLVVMAALFVVPWSMGAPEPSRVPQSWELEFQFQDPIRIDVTLPGDKKPTTFWYMLYTVTNKTGREVLFYPQFDVVTNTLEVVRAGDEVSPSVFEAIRKRHKKQYPFLSEPLKVNGKLLQGEDNARSSVAVFRSFDPNADAFTVYIAGLSGEVVRVNNPAFDPDKPVSEDNRRFFTLRKTLAISYDFPGDAGSREHAQPVRKDLDWVMR